MRFWFSGPRILGIRTGVSFGASDWQAGSQTGQRASVYVIEGSHGLIKIGISTNVQARIATLRTSSPFALHLVFETVCADAFSAEQSAHAALARYRMAGEWFDVPASVAIAAVQDSVGSVIDHNSDTGAAIWQSLFLRSLLAMVPFWLLVFQFRMQGAMFALVLIETLVAASLWRRLLALPQGPLIALKIFGVAIAAFFCAMPLGGMAAMFTTFLPTPWRPS